MPRRRRKQLHAAMARYLPAAPPTQARVARPMGERMRGGGIRTTGARLREQRLREQQLRGTLGPGRASLPRRGAPGQLERQLVGRPGRHPRPQTDRAGLEGLVAVLGKAAAGKAASGSVWASPKRCRGGWQERQSPAKELPPARAHVVGLDGSAPCAAPVPKRGTKRQFASVPSKPEGKRPRAEEKKTVETIEISSEDEAPPVPSESRLKLDPKRKKRSTDQPAKFRSFTMDEIGRSESPLSERNTNARPEQSDVAEADTTTPVVSRVRKNGLSNFEAAPRTSPKAAKRSVARAPSPRLNGARSEISSRQRKPKFRAGSPLKEVQQREEHGDSDSDVVVHRSRGATGRRRKERSRSQFVTPVRSEDVRTVEDYREERPNAVTRRVPRASVTVPPEHPNSTARPRLRRQITTLKENAVPTCGKPDTMSNEPIVISSDDEGVVETDALAEDFSRLAEISPQRFYSNVEQPSARTASKRLSAPVKQGPDVVHLDDENNDSLCDSPVGKRQGQLRKNFDIRLQPPNAAERSELRKLVLGVPERQVMAQLKGANISLTCQDFRRLLGSATGWINDEVVNAFAHLLNQRNKSYFAERSSQAGEAPKLFSHSHSTTRDEGAASMFTSSRPRVHVFNSFFLTLLTSGSRAEYDYKSVRRWMKRAGREVHSLDLILFPVNIKNVHWVLAAIDIRSRLFIYMDSMYGVDVLDSIKHLRRWFTDEVTDKYGKDVAEQLEVESWRSVINPPFVPRQNDGGSCGIFTLYMAEYLERATRPSFAQGDISALRQRTSLFLKRGALPVS